jgi:hypothetical protein
MNRARKELLTQPFVVFKAITNVLETDALNGYVCLASDRPRHSVRRDTRICSRTQNEKH